jgi:primase-polymerase (primpol)-like protein
VTALDALASEPRWVAWRIEIRGDKPAKVPYAPQGGRAKADDHSTWGSRAEAEARAARIVDGQGGGVGIELGGLGGDTHLAGIDLDSCLSEEGALAPWAEAILSAAPTYATTFGRSSTGLAFWIVNGVVGEASPARTHATMALRLRCTSPADFLRSRTRNGRARLIVSHCSTAHSSTGSPN